MHMLSKSRRVQVWGGDPEHPPTDAHRGDALLVPHLLPPQGADLLPSWRRHPGAHVAVLSKSQGGRPDLTAQSALSTNS